MIFAVIGDFLRALGQLGDPRFRRVLWLGIGLTIALLAAVYAGLLALIQWFVPETLSLPLVGEIGGIGALLSVGSLLVMLGLSVFLMVPVASAFIGLFLEDVADAVEARHYPHLPQPPRLPLGQAAIDAFNFFMLLVAVNVLALFLYPFAGPLTPILFWAVNGYLLGREFFQVAAMRRLGRKGARTLYRSNRSQVWLAGTLMTAPLTIPVVNLVVPVLGAATFTHLYHRLAPRETRISRPSG